MGGLGFGIAASRGFWGKAVGEESRPYRAFVGVGV